LEKLEHQGARGSSTEDRSMHENTVRGSSVAELEKHGRHICGEGFQGFNDSFDCKEQGVACSIPRPKLEFQGCDHRNPCNYDPIGNQEFHGRENLGFCFGSEHGTTVNPTSLEASNCRHDSNNNNEI